MKKYIPKPGVPKPVIVTPPGKGKNQKRPIQKHTIGDKGKAGGPVKPEKRPLPKPINKSGLKKDGPSGKKGSISMSVKKPILLSRKKTAGR